MDAKTLTLLVVVIGAGTLTWRSLFICSSRWSKLPGWVETVLNQVPASALSALIVPAVIYVQVEGSYSFSPGRVTAGVLALAAATFFRNIAVTLVVGMAALWVIQFF